MYVCPCESKQSYTLCCGRYHKGKLHAPTAEALMRARYCAYVLGNAQYIYRTWDKTTRPTLQSLREAGPQKFSSLEILSRSKGGVDDETGTVEFIASFDHNDLIESHHENSEFMRLENRWVYIKALQ